MELRANARRSKDKRTEGDPPETVERTVFYNIDELYNEELYDDLVYLYEVASPINTTTKAGRSVKNQLKCTIQVADAYYEVEEYEKSIEAYRKALILFANVSLNQKRYSEVEVRYRMHKAFLKHRNPDEAYAILKSIPEENAPLKVKSGMAKLLMLPFDWDNPQKAINQKSSITKIQLDVYNKCPSALRNVCNVLHEDARLGASLKAETVAKNYEGPEAGCLKGWLLSQELAREKRYPEAVQALQIFSDNPKALIQSALLYFRLGMRCEARKKLHIVATRWPDNFEQMDLLAYLYSLEYFRFMSDLETLTNNLSSRSHLRPETFIALGYLAKAGMSKESKRETESTTKAKRAVFFGGRATELAIRGTSQYSHALILKAAVLEDMDKKQDAIDHLKEGIKLDPTNFDLNDALVECHLSNNDFREAKAAAGRFLDLVPDDPQARLLNASVSMKTANVNQQELVATVEGIVRKHPYLLDSVYLLMQLYEKSNEPKKSVAMVERVVQESSIPQMAMGKIHELLGNLYSQANEPLSAYDHFLRSESAGNEVDPAQMNEVETQLRALSQSIDDEPMTPTGNPDARPPDSSLFCQHVF
ncbi:unnamed protein product [Caenorhabditis auriculariae]|uniref:Uncharacterized protein n=1 Tax=Caenorhabditis auriculariae TaxID=2777116 RepID=A0A8S1HK35_9PELO|nr:unnamed protein product [Caenorhabditis auriculariae]